MSTAVTLGPDCWRPARGADWVEDVLWLLATGECDGDQIAARTFRRGGAQSVIRELYRLGRHDLVARVTGPREPRQRTRPAPPATSTTAAA